MRSTQLDFGLAMAAALKGHTVKRKGDSRLSLVYREDTLRIIREKGRDVNLSKSPIPFECLEEDWYIIGDCRNWLEGR